MDDKILYYIWLSSSLHPGSSVPKALFNRFGSIDKIYNAQKEDYEAAGISKADTAPLCNKSLETAKKYLEYCQREKIGLLCFEDPYYPERLKIIDNPPPLFYYRGRLNLLDDYPCITMVGTRSCSERGFRLAYEVGFDAASKGAVIVNGLALGIDGACIAGALDANGYAVGLLGCGIDRIYPSQNKELFERLSASGLILTEFSPFSKPDGKNFPIRNRVMSALSLATVVFEADASSGALITAKHALQQGRRIFAVPGKPYDKTYSGPLELIKDGATVFTEADDVLSEYAMSFPHRINLANKNTPSKDKLDLLIAKYFKKDTDPEAPVNRRQLPVGGFENKNRNSRSSQSKPSSNENYNKPSHYKDKPAMNSTQSTLSGKAKKNEKPSDSSATGEDNSSKACQNSANLSILSVTEREIYELFIKHKSLSPDDIASLGVKIEDTLSALTLLEIYGLISSRPGGKYEIV